MQWFDEYDYDADRFVDDVRYLTNAEAFEALDEMPGTAEPDPKIIFVPVVVPAPVRDR